MSRIRITISISKNLASEVDRRVDGTHIRNRSHAIETLLSESLKLSSIKTAVILAGGTDAIKRIPSIKHSLSQLHSLGISKIIVAVGYLGKEIIDHLEQSTIKDKYRQRLEYHQSGSGTGGVLFELKSKLTKPFFVVNVKDRTKVDLRDLSRFHNEHKPIATIATKSLKDLNGYYLIEPAIFDYIPKGFSSLEDDIFIKLTKDGKLLSYPVLT